LLHGFLDANISLSLKGNVGELSFFINLIDCQGDANA